MAEFSQTVWDHFINPRNVGRVEKFHAEGNAGGRRAGPYLCFTARIKGNILEEVRFQTYGCAPAIAAGSYLTETVQGKTIQEASGWTVERLLHALGGLPEDKHHCAVLAIQALQSLLRGIIKTDPKQWENYVD